MGRKTEKRSSGEGIRPAAAPVDASAQGVGGRQGGSLSSLEGGGYQDVYTPQGFIFKKNGDPRIDELRAMGLGKKWIEIAERIGVDAFLEVWQILDSGGASHREEVRIYIPAFNTYLRFQRNRLIVALAEQGHDDVSIQQSLRKHLCEEISRRHITRIVAKLRIPA